MPNLKRVLWDYPHFLYYHLSYDMTRMIHYSHINICRKWVKEKKRKFHLSHIDETSHINPFYYLGCGGDGACVIIGDVSVGVEMGGMRILLSKTREMRLELDVVRLSMDFMHSDALFSIIKASSSSRTMSIMHGR